MHAGTGTCTVFGEVKACVACLMSCTTLSTKEKFRGGLCKCMQAQMLAT